ncbi:tetratricopeptide repeat protein [Pseudomonas syringae pv. actinidiae]|nr:tetratricopeptide repeat protein [Pseudomonas syringae pv. actinidiae]
MIRKFLVCLIPLLLSMQGCAIAPQTDSQVLTQALELQYQGEYEKALPLWTQLSDHGDAKATVTLALMYHSGTGVEQDFNKAMDLYLSVWDRNGDAMNNLGVMFRDGQGVESNRRIAYSLFFATYMRSLGSDDTMIRAGRNFDRENETLPLAERDEASCFTMNYVIAYVETKGRLQGIPESLKANKDRPRLRDIDEDDIMADTRGSKCPANS